MNLWVMMVGVVGFQRVKAVHEQLVDSGYYEALQNPSWKNSKGVMWLDFYNYYRSIAVWYFLACVGYGSLVRVLMILDLHWVLINGLVSTGIALGAVGLYIIRVFNEEGENAVKWSINRGLNGKEK